MPENNTEAANKAQDRYRVAQGDQSFDIEKRSGVDKHGQPVWLKLEYHRKRSDLLAALSRLGLSANLADKVSPYHPAAFRALASVAEAPVERSEAQREAVAKAHAAKRAKRDA